MAGSLSLDPRVFVVLGVGLGVLANLAAVLTFVLDAADFVHDREKPLRWVSFWLVALAGLLVMTVAAALWLLHHRPWSQWPDRICTLMTRRRAASVHSHGYCAGRTPR